MVMLVSILALVLTVGLVSLVGVVLQAAIGWRIGGAVERISVGFGPVVWSRTIQGTELSLAAIPMGGYISVFEMDEEKDRNGKSTRTLSDENSCVPWSETPIFGRMVVSVAGHATSILTGCVFLSLPVVLGTPQLTADGSGLQIEPVSVTTIGLIESPSTLAGQLSFVDGTFVRFWSAPITAIQSGNWGGALSWFYTTGFVTTHDFGGWFTCCGELLLVSGGISFIPFPRSTGWQLVLLVLESIGLPLSEQAIMISNVLGFLFFTCVHIVFLVLDVRWLL